MKIYDIPQGTKITINMVHNKTNYTVEATVITRYGDGVLVSPLYCGGELIDICNDAHFEYSEAVTEKKHLFQADNISRVDFSGTDFHVILGREVVVAENMRKAERYKVQIMGNATINRTEALSVIIHDISMRGFSLMVGKRSNCKVGDRVKVEFTKDSKSTKLELRGIVVRCFKIGPYEAVGCETENISPNVIGFVMEKKEEAEQKKEVVSAVKPGDNVIWSE